MRKYKFAVIATDIAIFTVLKGQLQVLLIQMKKYPYRGKWALPGGLVGSYESVDKAAERQLASKTNVKNAFLEQLYTFGKVDRDPFGRVVSVAYFALIPEKGIKLATTSEYSNVRWFKVKKLPMLAYDHLEIIEKALKRLRIKLEYTNIVYSLLPNEFSLTELQTIYEVILDRKLDKRNFRKKILSLGLIEKTGKKQQGDANRPAELYKFTNRKPQLVDML